MGKQLIVVVYALLKREIAELGGVQGAHEVYFLHHLVVGELRPRLGPQCVAFGFGHFAWIRHRLQLRRANDFNRSIAQDCVD